MPGADNRNLFDFNVGKKQQRLTWSYRCGIIAFNFKGNKN